MGSGKTFLKECCNEFRQELDTNIFAVSFTEMQEDQKKTQIHSGDPLYCQNCKGILNKHSNLNLLVQSGSISQYKWNCEFCSYNNEIQIEQNDIPENEEALYCIQPHLKQQSQSGQDKCSITFCLDTSGSMSTTTEIKGKIECQPGLSQQEYEMLKKYIQPETQIYLNKSKDISYVSRKQCLLTAIEQQIKMLKQQNPEIVVGLVTFNNEVVVYGDGSQQPIKFSEQQLYQEVQMRTVLSGCAKQMMQNPITKQADKLINVCQQLQDNGQTALGPALISALELAKVGKPGSMIIICTDGLANLGLGALDCESNRKFYQELGQLAAEKGIIISLVTIKGEGCKIDTLGELVEKTNGIVTRVNPERIGQDFSNIINDIVIGTQVELKVILHKALKFRREENSRIKNNTLKKHIGNITKSSIYTFEYQLKTAQELKKENIDIKKLKQIPFQIRITYTNLKGDKMMRVVTKLMQTTQNIEEAEKEVQVDVIHKRIAQKTAQIAKQGNYEEAQIYNQYWNQYIQKNPHINSNQINQKKNQNFQKHNEKLSTALKNQESRKYKSIQIQENQQKIPSIDQKFLQSPPNQITQTPDEPFIYPSMSKKFSITPLKSQKPPLYTDKKVKNIENLNQQPQVTIITSDVKSFTKDNKIQSNSITTADSQSNQSKFKSSQNSSQSNESDEDQDYTILFGYERAKF
ncbi:unnamed protein product [Paramecium primaurelia]|uniref:Sec23/Sec24 trunk domain-containing protein n=1 Tax=Paramecium primaurelia TaxID=5886 RepID=A0A8S1Q3X3_PARPR|nr:unnamed protein product [Paramecium primaurelia]